MTRPPHASEKDRPAEILQARTVPQLFLARVDATPRKEAYRRPRADTWEEVTWEQAADTVRRISCALAALDLRQGERCGILCSTRVDWILVDLGILCAGGATTTVYPPSTPEECAYILGDSQAGVAFVEDDEQAAKLIAQRGNLPKLRQVVVLDGSAAEDGWVVTLDEFLGRGEEAHGRDPDAFRRRAESVESDALATLIYTSGTTGQPKGVELTHDNWVYESEGIDSLDLLHPDDLQYLWLPLSHSFGKVLQVAQLRIGFPTAVDGRVDRIVDNLGEIQPTFVAAVPRIFEKVHGKVKSGVREAGGLKKVMFEWAEEVGKATSRTLLNGDAPGALQRMKHAVADRLVFSKLRQRFGGRIRYFISGSAPLSPELIEFFHAAGITILEGYGLTETSAATFVNRPGELRLGTVGKPLPGTEVKLADDGEILIRGRGVMRGYHGLDDATEETLQDGWLATGDIGEVDEDGFLKITDRKKDLIKTAAGKYVAPQQIEGMLKARCSYLGHVAVHGDTRKYCTAILVFDPEELKKWGEKQGFEGDYEALATRPEAHALLEPFVEEVNRELPRHAQLKYFAVAPRDLTMEHGELTPSLKMKRRNVEKNFKDLLDAMYEG